MLQSAWENGHSYFAMADQDDYGRATSWRAVSQVSKKYLDPALYCARQTLVDVDLNRMGSSPHFGQPIGFPAALTQNIAAGCTIVLNRPAADLVRQTL